jgi:hypothetical protein
MKDDTSAQDNSKKAELHSALIKAIGETKDIVADSNNPFHKSKYASLSAHLSAIKPIFAKHNLAIIQFPCSSSTLFGEAESGIGVKTIVIHSNGASLEASCIIPVEKGASGQQAGAIISYLRRYSLASVAGVATEDDDCEIDRISRPVSQNSTTKYIPNPNASKPAQVSGNAPAPANAPVVPSSAGDIDPSIPVPFGNNKGTPVGELSLNDLTYWATKWEPRPYEKTGKVTAKDAKLKATAVALYEMASSGQSEGSDEVPF